MILTHFSLTSAELGSDHQVTLLAGIIKPFTTVVNPVRKELLSRINQN
jgi:hypothetical protein